MRKRNDNHLRLVQTKLKLLTQDTGRRTQDTGRRTSDSERLPYTLFKIPVVDRPSSNLISSTRPPQLSTSFQPTTDSFVV